MKNFLIGLLLGILLAENGIAVLDAVSLSALVEGMRTAFGKEYTRNE